MVDNQEYSISSVGNVVEKNLTGLGHITISFDGSKEGSLPGTLHVVAEQAVVIEKVLLFRFLKLLNHNKISNQAI